ncbi:Os12g0123400 [Oryza sativa Japonica Group]|uniref:Os12g0123400 protein n=1 Tax=Oryza sativa subsp. japonica TaxID=39947 RepID=A0A0P0Y6U2_ORYSJ|nr:Os12g0123400 [Oryza sativa Japonica Group]
MQALHLWDRLEAIQLQPDSRDSFVWKLSADGNYYSSSAYSMFFMGKTKVVWVELVWGAKVTPRCKMFMYLTARGSCLTSDNLDKRRWPSCPLCSSGPETGNHLFGRNCDSASAFSRKHQISPGMVSWWLHEHELHNKQGKKVFDARLFLFYWLIWKERNGRVFEGVSNFQDSNRGGRSHDRGVVDLERCWFRC